MRALWVTMISVGVSCLVLGIGSFIYGGWILEGSQHYRIGAMTGWWSRGTYALVGTIAAAFGAGSITAGVLGMRGEARRERDAGVNRPVNS